MLSLRRACCSVHAPLPCNLSRPKAALRQSDLAAVLKHSSQHNPNKHQRRCRSNPSNLRTSSLLTLAIETSCDDTSVAILEKKNDNAGKAAAKLHFHDKVTSNNLEYRGVHPTVALISHQQELGNLVKKALLSLPTQGASLSGHLNSESSPKDEGERRLPDFVSVTRGPGMRSNLSVGLDTAKGLSLAWGVPLLAVNHMQAHALTPRLVEALANWSDEKEADCSSREQPELTFPFLSLLVSGGHTLLISSMSLTSHPIVAETIDTAIGDYIDKSARAILPVEALGASSSAMYGPALELYAFPGTANPSQGIDYEYTPPRSHREALSRRETPWGWSLAPPFSQGSDSPYSRNNAFTFAGLGSVVQQLGAQADLKSAERQCLAREAMRVVFEHLASRVVATLSAAPIAPATLTRSLVVAGGVAANGFLRHILRAYLDAWGYSDVRLLVPPVSLCTDNAAMIAWTGMEMFEAGWRSKLSARPLRRWGLDEHGDDGGILGVGGWTKAAT